MYDPSAWTPNSEFMQSLFCNHSAIFTVQSLLCYVFFCNILLTILKNSRFFWVFLSTYCKKYKTCVFLQHFVESTEKPLVPLCFFALGVQKHHKTCAFCITLLNMLENVGFPLFLALIL